MEDVTNMRLTKTPSPVWLSWLTYQQALTKRLDTLAGNSRLQVLSHAWGAADRWDKDVLMLKDTQIIHREILMWAQDVPCWYARTILPQTTYEANHLFYDRLANETLGDLIFNTPKLERLSLIHYNMQPESTEATWVMNALAEHPYESQETHWIRSSAFSLENASPFYLVEILLPGLARFFP